MGAFSYIKDRFKKHAPVVERKTIVIPIKENSFIEFLLGGSGYITATQAMQYYRENSSIATAVDLIADAFEQINPVLELPDGELITDHDVLDRLLKPNGFETWQSFAGAMSRHYLLTHDSHISALGSVLNPPIELYALKPQNVMVQENHQDSYPNQYMATMGASRGTYVRNEDIKRGAKFYDGNLKELYHIMGFSSRANNITGDSPLNAAALEANQQIKGRTHNLQMLENGGRLSLIVSFKNDESFINDDEHQQRKLRINEDLGGENNAGKIAVISGTEVDIQEVGKSNKDMDYALLDQIASQAIYLRYKIPLPLVSTSASTFNNMKTAIEIFYDQATLPHAKTMFDGLTKMLLPRYKLDDTKYRITYDPESITALMERRLDELMKRRKANIETTNELRGLLPKRGDIDGGNVIYQPANLIPLGADIFGEDEKSLEELEIELKNMEDL